MKKSFLIGAVAGASALIIAVPLLAQFSSAQTTGSSSSGTPPARPVPSQACVLALAGKDAAYLSNIDAFIAAQKTATSVHEDALNKAAGIADDTLRQAAVKAANDAFRTAMQTAMTAEQTAEKTALDAVKTACGNVGGGFGGFGMMGMRGPGGRGGPGQGQNQTALAAKLGITVTQLQSELAGGKTIRQIAAEHGVTLPTPKGEGRGGWFGRGPVSAGNSQTSSAQ